MKKEPSARLRKAKETVEADQVILAIGQAADLSFLSGNGPGQV